MSLKILRKLSARKAKYGFKIDCFGESDIIPLGRILETINSLYRNGLDFHTSFDSNYSKCEFTIYTDEEHVADFIDKNYVK